MSSEFRFQLIRLAKKVWPGSSQSSSMDEHGVPRAERLGSASRGGGGAGNNKKVSSEYQPDRESQLVIQPPMPSTNYSTAKRPSTSIIR